MSGYIFADRVAFSNCYTLLFVLMSCVTTLLYVGSLGGFTWKRFKYKGLFYLKDQHITRLQRKFQVKIPRDTKVMVF